MTQSLGEFKKLNAKTIWPHEEYDFSPWLAQEDNIAQLAKAIGIELQVEGVEVPVGGFSADILARTSSDSYVIIENQFGKTDHNHLGKTLTYAPMLNATSIIWIAEKFTAEHRKTIEWLNDHTTTDLNLFAVELELWTIDGSKPAVRFNVVSQPTEVAKEASRLKESGELSDKRKIQLQFWTAVRDALLQKKILTSAHTPRPQYWFDVSLGKTGIHLSNTANTTNNRIGVRLYMTGKIADEALAAFDPQRKSITSEVGPLDKALGEEFNWNPNPENQDKVITLTRDADLSDLQKWPEYVDWMCSKIALFRKIFKERIKNM